MLLICFPQASVSRLMSYVQPVKNVGPGGLWQNYGHEVVVFLFLRNFACTFSRPRCIGHAWASFSRSLLNPEEVEVSFTLKRRRMYHFAVSLRAGNHGIKVGDLLHEAR